MKTKYHEHTHNITENRAPTDESVRLLNEFQDKAIKNLLSQVLLSDNIVNGHMLALTYSMTSMDCQIHFRFKLNGKEHGDTLIMERSELYSLQYTDTSKSAEVKLIQLLYKKLSERIAELLITSNEEFMREFISKNY